jgi:HSP20 family molecular chaperone IbpA
MHETEIFNEINKYLSCSPRVRYDICRSVGPRMPNVIVTKSETSIDLSLAVVGANKEDITLSYSGGILKISVPRNKTRDNWYVDWSRSETDLYCTIDLKRHDLLYDLSKEFIAVLENGILTLSIPLTNTEKTFAWK